MFGGMAITNNRYACEVILVQCSQGLQILICYYFDEWGVVSFFQTHIWWATLSGRPRTADCRISVNVACSSVGHLTYPYTENVTCLCDKDPFFVPGRD